MTTFDQALDARINDEILDRCTLCGKCAAVCPMPAPAGLDAATEASGAKVVSGVIDLLRGGEGRLMVLNGRKSAPVRASASRPARRPSIRASCSPWRGSRPGAPSGAEATRAKGRQSFGTMSNAVRAISRLQLPADILARINPASAKAATPEPDPEVIYYTGCNMLRTPHIGLLCLEVLDAMEVPYKVMGGPGHCCGIFQFREGDTETGGKDRRPDHGRLCRLKGAGGARLVSKLRGAVRRTQPPDLRENPAEPAPFDMVAFYIWLARRLDDLAPLMTIPVNRRVALVERPAFPAPAMRPSRSPRPSRASNMSPCRMSSGCRFHRTI